MLLCEAVADQTQMLKIKSKEEESDDEKEDLDDKDLDDLHKMFMNSKITKNEEEQTKEETAYEGESDKAEGIDGTPEESPKGVEEEDKGSNSSVEEVDHKMLRIFTKPKVKDELVNSWWETVMSTFQVKENEEGQTGEGIKPEDEVKVVTF